MKSKTPYVVLILICLIALGYLAFRPRTEVVNQDGTATSTPSTAYASSVFGFSVEPPEGFTSNEAHIYSALGPGKEIPGVAFMVPTSLTAGTNLSKDSYISVERRAEVSCSPSDFIYTLKPGTPVTFGNTTYQKASTSDAGAGNLYEETVYVTKQGASCYAVREFIHSGNIGNYPEGTVKAFDRAALDSAAESMVASLKFN